MNKEQWLKERQNYIGGSDAAAVLGISKWKSPLAVYMEKTGEAPHLEPSRAMNMGILLEDLVAQDFTKETGLKVRRKKETIVHPQYDFIRANIDRKIEGKDEGLECKITSTYNKKDWEDTAPDYYIIQCMVYMAVTGYKKWWLACWVGFDMFPYYIIEYDAKLANQIIDRLVVFWNEHILKKNPPEVIYSDTNLLKELYKNGGLESIELIDQKENIEKFLEITKQMKVLKDEKELYSNKLKNQLGDHETGSQDNYMVNWKSQNRITLDSKKLKEEQPEIYSSYSRETKLRKFDIKEMK